MLTIRNKCFVKALIILTVASAMMVSCNRKAIYNRFAHTNLKGWNNTDTLLYNIGKIEADGTYERNVGLRISNSYPFKSISLLVVQNWLKQGKSRRDTIECKLYDDNGDILGQGISLYQYRFKMDEMDLAAGDSLEIKISHIMRKELLPGVADVGFELKGK